MPTGRTRRRNTIRQVSRRREKGDGGFRFRISPHPPSITTNPWFNLVVRINSPATPVTTLALRAAMDSQLGLPGGPSFVVRLQSVRFWGALYGASPSTPPPAINVQVNDPIGLQPASATGGIGQRALEVITDYPDVVRRACIGYRYPRAQREAAIALPTINGGNLYVTNGMGDGSVIYVNLQWRPLTNVPPSVFSDLPTGSLPLHDSDLESEFESLSVDANAKTRAIQEAVFRSLQRMK